MTREPCPAQKERGMYAMIDTILNMDCMDGLKDIPDNYVDLIVMDPPYEFKDTRGGGSFGSEKRTYHSELDPLSKGVTQEILDVLCGKMKAINIYIWCNKNQLRQYIDYFDDRGCNIDLLTWHKTNPVPTCSNKYLSDTEYCVFARESGVKVYGTYETKRKWYVSELNTANKKAYGHPTVKPLNIIRNLVSNSSRGGGSRARSVHGFRNYGGCGQTRWQTLYRFRDRPQVLRDCE